MKKLRTGSDSGELLFGNSDFQFRIPNGFVDGVNIVLMFDSEEEYFNYCKKEYGERRYKSAFEYVMQITGNFNLYKHDCCDVKEESIVTKLNGTYNIYIRSEAWELPVVAIVKN